MTPDRFLVETYDYEAKYKDIINFHSTHDSYIIALLVANSEIRRRKTLYKIFDNIFINSYH